jgi:hypothetical protein
MKKNHKNRGEYSNQEYLLDSGATTHVMTSDDDAYDIR